MAQTGVLEKLPRNPRGKILHSSCDQPTMQTPVPLHSNTAVSCFAICTSTMYVSAIVSFKLVLLRFHKFELIFPHKVRQLILDLSLYLIPNHERAVSAQGDCLCKQCCRSALITLCQHGTENCNCKNCTHAIIASSAYHKCDLLTGAGFINLLDILTIK